MRECHSQEVSVVLACCDARRHDYDFARLGVKYKSFGFVFRVAGDKHSDDK